MKLNIDNETWHVFTDGACKGNPGPGGWAAVIIGGGRVVELGGGSRKTTNNRMEMNAPLECLKVIPDGEKVILRTDSSYVMNGITKWIYGWKRNGWLTKDKKPVLNSDLWMELDKVNNKNVEWLHVKGHAGHYLNERCDVIAVAFSRNEPVSLRNDAINDIDDFYDINKVLDPDYKSPVVKKAKNKKKKNLYPNEKKYMKKVYLFFFQGKLYRFQDWPSCQAFSSGKSGHTKGCMCRAEEEDYVKSAGLPISVLEKVIES